MRMIFSTDGEACILKEVFSPEILAGLRDALTDYLKNGPSCSSKTQSADVSDNFRDWKKGLVFASASASATTPPCASTWRRPSSSSRRSIYR
jgi:hypothetical protein